MEYLVGTVVDIARLQLGDQKELNFRNRLKSIGDYVEAFHVVNLCFF
jgi:hypothetical protein